MAGIFKETDFIADGIGKDGFENEALPLAEQFGPKSRGDMAGCIGLHIQLMGEEVGVQEAEPGCLEMGFIEGAFARAIRTSEGHDDGAAVQLSEPTHAF